MTAVWLDYQRRALTEAVLVDIGKNMITCCNKPAKAKKSSLKGTEVLRTL
jgi:hypothetical protein